MTYGVGTVFREECGVAGPSLRFPFLDGIVKRVVHCAARWIVVQSNTPSEDGDVFDFEAFESEEEMHYELDDFVEQYVHTHVTLDGSALPRALTPEEIAQLPPDSQNQVGATSLAGIAGLAGIFGNANIGDRPLTNLQTASALEIGTQLHEAADALNPDHIRASLEAVAHSNPAFDLGLLATHDEVRVRNDEATRDAHQTMMRFLGATSPDPTAPEADLVIDEVTPLSEEARRTMLERAASFRRTMLENATQFHRNTETGRTPSDHENPSMPPRASEQNIADRIRLERGGGVHVVSGINIGIPARNPPQGAPEGLQGLVDRYDRGDVPSAYTSVIGARRIHETQRAQDANWPPSADERTRQRALEDDLEAMRQAQAAEQRAGQELIDRRSRAADERDANRLAQAAQADALRAERRSREDRVRQEARDRRVQEQQVRDDQEELERLLEEARIRKENTIPAEERDPANRKITI